MDGLSGIVRTRRMLSRDQVGEISFVAQVSDTNAASPSVQTATGEEIQGTGGLWALRCEDLTPVWAVPKLNNLIKSKECCLYVDSMHRFNVGLT